MLLGKNEQNYGPAGYGDSWEAEAGRLLVRLSQPGTTERDLTTYPTPSHPHTKIKQSNQENPTKSK